MAKGPRYCVPFRRRREGRTDYKARRALLASGKPRLVVRRSPKNIITQIITAKPKGDETIVSSFSGELSRDYGWKAPRGNLPASYLTGHLCGLKAKAKGIDEAILDVGLGSPTKGAAVFAALRGVLDAGLKIPHSKEKLPSEERIRGEHIAEYARMLSAEPEQYQTKFSQCLKSKLKPEKLPEHFEKTRREIATSLARGEKA